MGNGWIPLLGHTLSSLFLLLLSALAGSVSTHGNQCQDVVYDGDDSHQFVTAYCG